MTLKKSARFYFRTDEVNGIHLESEAEAKSMNIAEFIRYCIDKEIDKTTIAKKEQEQKELILQKQNDAQKIIEELVHCNKLIHGLNEKIMLAGFGIVNIQKAFILLFPNSSDELYKLFGEKKNV